MTSSIAPQHNNGHMEKSPHPVRKYVDRLTSLDIEEYPQWDCTKPLPLLPVPSLENTFEKYLLCIKPVVTNEQYEHTKTLVGEFIRPGGQGHSLQALLEARAKSSTNWAYDFWLDDMYMKNKLPLPINSNPGMVFPRMMFEDRSEQLRFAARLITAILDYKFIIDSRSMPVDRASSREKGQPLCMEQYYRLFTSYRLPGHERDMLTNVDDGLSDRSTHVIVACKNQFFVLDTEVNESRLSNDNLYAQLKRIVACAEEQQANAEPVGIFTAAQRDRWAQARERLADDLTNQNNFKLIENAMFLLCLDNALSQPDVHNGQNGDTMKDMGFLAKQILHGCGSEHNTSNRWFDMTLQFIIGEDGSCGLCYEHSPAEGIAVTQLIEHLLKYMDEVKKTKLARMQSLCDLPAPKKLTWNLTDELRAELSVISDLTDRMIRNTHLRVLRFESYGKEFVKSMNMSPDAYMQLALQLTFYRIHNRLVPTYESASTRRFRSGRVDNIRACTLEALEWAKAMLKETKSSAEETMALLRAAIKRQTDILVQTILGYGIDNHLLALKYLAQMSGQPVPDVFQDDSYIMSNQFTLSTSQVPSSLDTLTCYGPVVPDGYGACYNLQPNYIVVCVTSFKSCGHTNSENFADQLEMSLTQMYELCRTVRQSGQSATPEANGKHN